MSDYSKINDAYAEHCRSQGLPTYMDLLTKLDEAEKAALRAIAAETRKKQRAYDAQAEAEIRANQAEERERALIAGVREALEGLEKYPMLDRSVTINSLSRLLDQAGFRAGQGI